MKKLFVGCLFFTSCERFQPKTSYDNFTLPNILILQKLDTLKIKIDSLNQKIKNLK